MSRSQVLGKWITAAGLGFAAAFYFYFTFINPLILTRFQAVFALVYLAAFFTLLAYVLFWLALSRLSSAGYSLPSRLLWCAGAALAGFLLYLMLPVSTPNFIVENQTLEIIATGEKNPAAKAAEVWLHVVQLPDGQKLELKDFKQLGDWSLESGSIAAFRNFPVRLRWQGVQTGEYRLIFGLHPWSGKVAVIWNGAEQVYDLYADPGSIQQISLVSKTNTPAAYKLLYGLTASLTLGLLIFLLSVFFVTYSLKRPAKPQTVARWWWLVYSLPIIVVELLYLLSFWPGIMSSDSHDQWVQMIKFSMNDNHPAFHTLVIWLVTRVWLTPAMVGLTQIVIFSLLTAWALILFQRRGVPVWLNLAALGLILALPVPHFLNITLWKDVPYSLAFLWMMILVFLVVESHGGWAKRFSHIFLLGLAAALVGLFRHNGWPVSFATLFVLALFLPKGRGWIFGGLGIAIALFFGIKQFQYRALDVNPANPMLTYYAPLHLIGAHVAAGTPLAPAEAELLNQIRPTGDGWSYNCFTVDSIVFSEKFKIPEIPEIGSRILKTAFSLSLRAPRVSLDHVLCSSSMAWRVKELPGARTGTVALLFASDAVHYLYPYKDDYIPALRENPRLPTLKTVLTNQIKNPENSIVLKIIWRPAVYWIIGMLGIVLLALRQRDWRWLLLELPIAFQVGVFVLFPIAQTFRYLYSIALFLIVFWPLLFNPRCYPFKSRL